MTYCSKCGRKLEKTDKFCPGCGEKNPVNSESGNLPPASGRTLTGNNSSQNNAQHTVTQRPAQNQVKYVYVNKKTGKITNNPHVKTGSEGCLQYVIIALSAVAVVIVMVAGSVLLTDSIYGKSSQNSGLIDIDEEVSEVTSDDGTESWGASSEENSETISSEAVSSQIEVSSVPEIPEEVTAAYLNKKITGKWSTEVPYKNMTLPGVFEFDGNGKAKCTIKAFLFSKKFEGTYKISDGGRCVLTLNGLEEYFEGDTLEGNLKFITDDSMEFTVDNTVWKLNRVK